MEQPILKKHLWIGRVLSGLAVAFLYMDGAMKLWKPAVVIEATRQLGYPESEIVSIGVLLLSCTTLYVFARTSIVGAVALTGYLGGAVASQMRAGNGWFNVLFPVMLGLVVWGGLWLRDTRVRTFMR